MKLPSLWRSPSCAALLPILGLVSAACGGSSDSPTQLGSAGASSGSNVVGDPNKLVGSFQVKLTPASDLGPAATSIVGRIYDAPTPVTTRWEEPQLDGNCTLTTPRVPFCSTPCGGSAACVEDDTCVAYPTAHGAGVVTMTGLQTTNGSTPLELKLVGTTYQAPPSIPLAYPPFAEGDAVTLTAAGDYFPAFGLSSRGIAPLALTESELALKSGQSLTLNWTKGTQGAASIHVKLDISHHGGSKGQIECDSSDSGALTVSAALIGKLLNLGVAGFPSVIVTRHLVDSTVIPAGRVELEISSSVEQAVTIDGLVSCTDKADCPSGQTCQPDLTCK
ncbi:MAG TPA: hypothetical protein VER12_14390 [Polyangiaceae bacterium]|nr:hypothetical protein [Polyangiaceae bacterium]HYQ27953.1 hypothetical protein [Polyangiaceae bacterium]